MTWPHESSGVMSRCQITDLPKASSSNSARALATNEKLCSCNYLSCEPARLDNDLQQKSNTYTPERHFLKIRGW